MPTDPRRLVGGERGLAATEPEGEEEPDHAEGNGREGDAGEAEAERGEALVGPGGELVAAAIDEGLDEALRLVLVLARHDGEKDLHRRVGEREVGGAAEDQEGGER